MRSFLSPRAVAPSCEPLPRPSSRRASDAAEAPLLVVPPDLPPDLRPEGQGAFEDDIIGDETDETDEDAESRPPRDPSAEALRAKRKHLRARRSDPAPCPLHTERVHMLNMLFDAPESRLSSLERSNAAALSHARFLTLASVSSAIVVQFTFGEPADHDVRRSFREG